MPPLAGPPHAAATHPLLHDHFAGCLHNAAAYRKVSGYDSQGRFRKWKERLLTEKDVAGKAIRAMGYLLQMGKLKGGRRKALLSARRFFRNNLERMNYAWFVGGATIGRFRRLRQVLGRVPVIHQSHATLEKRAVPTMAF